MGLETASLVPLIYRLEQQNLIRRQTLAADKRQKLLITTAEGKALYRQVKNEADTLRNELLSYVSEPDLDTAWRVLDTLLQAAEAKQR
ncbi:MarR family winged helix-turn-helix transcriptional regulator [Candidatus Sodalis endolongispinus]|uniref:MarR family winged helix-turn-helix transcriptional regulator n=1 Tax=Candidatus Sodalis endolongispinus TaxID=2812662 RepID=UPI0035E4488B